MQLKSFKARSSAQSSQTLVVLLLATLTLGTPLSTQGQNEYGSDGVPTPLEEEIRWRVNRGRFDSASENLLRGTSYSDIPATAGPLAPHEGLTLACRHHSEDMARNDVFQHDTVPGSFYYDPITQPQPWDRFHAEGYFYNGAGENIAAGYFGAEQAYAAWWRSTGHRKNMYNSSMREIGNGYFYWQNSSYSRYYTMDLGRRNGSVFFTDTIFHDANGNQVYDSGEGIEGIAIRLRVGTSALSDFDVSAGPGSFAVPCASIPAGSLVTVVLSNATAVSQTLTIPRDHSTLDEVVLAAGQTLECGSFVQPSGSSNSGFRNVSPSTPTPEATQLRIAATGPDIELRWDSVSALQYLPQASCDCQIWTNLTATPLSGTGAMMSYVDTGATTEHKLYRLLISAP